MDSQHRGRATLAPGSHFAQFFDTPDSRIEHIAGYVATTLAAGERAVVVLHPRLWAEIRERLRAIGTNVDTAQAGRELVVYDGEQLLPTLRRGGRLDADVFDERVGDAIRELAGGGRQLRVYGELVDALAAVGDFGSAIELEQLWNRLIAEVRLTLFCGYSAISFGDSRRVPMLKRICECHSEVRAASHDMLASFLLATHVKTPHLTEQ